MFMQNHLLMFKQVLDTYKCKDAPVKVALQLK